MKVAIITYRIVTQGCQITNNVLTGWICGDHKEVEFEFEEDEKLTDIVAALQQYNEKYPINNFINTFECRYNYKVEILN
jgi:predicted P-loop ATPase